MAFRLAGELADVFGAAVEAVHYTVSARGMAVAIADDMSGSILASERRREAARAAVSEAAFGSELSKKPGSSFASAMRDDMDDMLIRARTTDLLVVGRPGSDPENKSPATVSAALFDSACPVIIAPPSGALGELKEIVIAWNGSQQAARAIRFALPFLKKAKSVTIVVVGAEKHPVGTKRIEEWLGRHGLTVGLVSIDPGVVSARARGRALLGFTHDRGASMLVMGAYGSSKVMEFLGLGGATTKVITACRVPVLMAH